MTNQDIKNKVIGILKEIKNDEKFQCINFDENIEPLLDSIEYVTLIVEIESYYDIEINDEDFEITKMNTVNKLAALVNSYIKKEHVEEVGKDCES